MGRSRPPPRHIKIISTRVSLLRSSVYSAVLLGLLAGTFPSRATTLVSLGTSSTCGTLTSGQVCTLTASVTGLPSAQVTFKFSPTVSGAVIGTPSGPNSSGTTTITYTAPNPVTSRQTVTATAAASDGTQASQLISLIPPSITIQVSPSSVTLSAGQTQQFTAAVLGVSSTGVTWSLSPATGTIDQNGNYTAPGSIASSQTVSVIATSTFDGTTTGTAKVTLQPPPSVTITISPTTASLTNGQTQSFVATVTNSAAAVVWSINPQTGAIDQSGNYTAPSTVTTAQKVTITATVAGVSATATVTLTVLVDVGTGAPTAALQEAFIQAFYRNGFSNLVSVPPQGNVASLGGGVLGQKFSDAAKDSGVTYALVQASPTLNPAPDGTSFPVAQIYPAIFAYYSTIGATTAGYPLSDTLNCPFFDPNNTCTYQEFDKSYLLVAYANALPNGTQTVDVTSTFFTEWNTLGGLAGPGLPTAASASITAATGTTATLQTFTTGDIFSITSGVNKGQLYGVIEPIFDLYQANGGSAGSLGVPTGNAITLTSGLVQQTFEGGTLQYTPGTGGAVLLPVGSVVITGVTGGQTFSLAPGQTMTLSAVVYSTSGQQITNRLISWISTNPNVVTVQPNGASATVTAIAGGASMVLAQSGGVSSSRVNFIVSTVCCQVGDGAPQAVVSEFLTALSRNQITAQLPIPDPATRSSGGYVQTVQSVSASGATTTYLVTAGDSASAAYVVTGALLSAYQSMGGPGGSLGYPVSDATAGGTQLFANGALGGSPIHLVNGPILAKWQALGLDSGAAGAPNGDASPFTTIDADSGVFQAFAQGTIYAATVGPRSGQTYFVSGLILAAYNAAGGVTGSLGMPTGDGVAGGGAATQNFEGGTIAYAAGASSATVTALPKVPSVMVAPATVSAGGHVVFAVTGFPSNHTVRVSQTGQPDFLVTTANGAYTWDTYVPLNSASSVVTIAASDTSGASTASGTLTIRSLVASRAGLTKVQGDNQTGMPGAALPLPLVVSLADSTGAPMGGVAVTFQASMGAQLSAGTVVTDGSGRAQTSVRLPASTGVTLVTASAPSVASSLGGASLVTFGAVSAAGNLPGFPVLQQSGGAVVGHGAATIAQKGALLTAVAGILQYHQNRGEIPSPNGPATPAALNAYLTTLCSPAGTASLCDGYLSNGSGGEQIVNLWRAAQFTGGLDVTVIAPAQTGIADLVATGEPVLLSLGLSRGGSAAGGNFVVATGVAADGSITIEDPNPLLSRSSLADYLNGFAAGGSNWQGQPVGAIRFAVRGPSPTRFLVGALSQPASLISAMTLNVASAAGNCGTAVQLDDTVDNQGNLPVNGPLISLLSVCDGTQTAYEVDLGASQAYEAFLTDLAAGGASTDLSSRNLVSYVLTRPQATAVLTPIAASVAANGIVNAATFTSGLAPGGIMAIFGTGLSGAGSPTSVTVDGTPAQVLFASAFQVNAQLPPATSPGTHVVQVNSAHGTASQQVSVSAVAPAIFLLSAPSAGAVLNQDFSINTPANPLPRGETLLIYATGLGATAKQGQYSITSTPVTAVVNGVEEPVAFSGLAPGFVGLYQVNLLIPSSIPPGSQVPLSLKQSGQVSNLVAVSIQ